MPYYLRLFYFYFGYFMRILITAGPTREYLDPVRFLTNGSSGQMGYACAAAAVARGHKVTLISGPTNLAKPAGLKFIPIISAADMAQATLNIYDMIDCVIMSAAVADYTPANVSSSKIIKMPGDMQLHMVRTMDILAKLGRTKQKQKLIGFAVQDKNARSNAKRKLLEKKLDAIVLNDTSAMGASRNTIHILKANQRNWQTMADKTKLFLGKAIVQLAEEITQSL